MVKSIPYFQGTIGLGQAASVRLQAAPASHFQNVEFIASLRPDVFSAALLMLASKLVEIQHLPV